MDDGFIQNALTYAARHQLQLAEYRQRGFAFLFLKEQNMNPKFMGFDRLK